MRIVLFFSFSLCVSAQGVITTLAGNGNMASSGDGGQATQASIGRVDSVAVDSMGNVYFTDESFHRVRKVDANGVINTVAGTGSAGYSGDGGQAVQALINTPTGVCVDSQNNIFVNDLSNRRVRKITPQGIITTVAGNGTLGSSGDGGPAIAAAFNIPIRCAVDKAGNLYIVDQGLHRVRRVDTNGNISNFAGNGMQGFSGDGGPAANAAMNNPTAAAFDAAGNLYITDQANQRIRRVDIGGMIQTIAGTGTATYGGDGGPATMATFNFPGTPAIDSAGSIFIVDSTANRIRRIQGGTINTVAGTGARGYGGDGGAPLQAMFADAFGIAIDAAGSIYVGDTANNRIRKISGLAAGAGPLITSLGVTNAASFQTGIAPGGIVTLFGNNLGAQPGQVVIAPGLTWPNTLAGVGVTMDGEQAAVYRVLNLGGQEQLSVQAPYSILGKNSVSVVVTTPVGASTVVSVPVSAAQPGIFVLDGANNGGTHANGSIVTAASPATAKEIVILYLTGLGGVNNQPATGQPASTTTLSPTTLPPQVFIGGFAATVSFSGLTPGYIGLYQINVEVPAGAPVGAVDVNVKSNGVTSNTVKLPVR